MIDATATIEENVILRQKIEIGHHAIIKCGAIVGTGVQIGPKCYIGPGAILLHMDPNGKSTPAILMEDVFIGAGAIILPGVVLESGVIIGAGAVVTKGKYTKGTYVGNPAKRLKK